MQYLEPVHFCLAFPNQSYYNRDFREGVNQRRKSGLPSVLRTPGILGSPAVTMSPYRLI